MDPFVGCPQPTRCGLASILLNMWGRVQVSVGLGVSGSSFVNSIAYVLVELFAGVLAATAFSVTHQAGDSL